MDTRNSAKAAAKKGLTEDELESVRLAQEQHEKRLRDESAAVNRERMQLEKERREFERNKETSARFASVNSMKNGYETNPLR